MKYEAVPKAPPAIQLAPMSVNPQPEEPPYPCAGLNSYRDHELMLAADHPRDSEPTARASSCAITALPRRVIVSSWRISNVRLRPAAENSDVNQSSVVLTAGLTWP